MVRKRHRSTSLSGASEGRYLYRVEYGVGCSDSPGEGRAVLVGSCTPRHSGMHAVREWQVAPFEVERVRCVAVIVGPASQTKIGLRSRLTSFGLCIHPEVNAVEDTARIPFSLPLPRVAPRTMPLRFAQTRLLAAF